MSISELAKNMFKGSKPMKGKELEILRKTTSRLISETPTSLKKPYGYVIEITSTVNIKSYKYMIPILVEYSFTDLYWNHKIYKKLEIAEEALNNIKKTDNINSTYKYEIVPLYK